jgi:hypothetical protein
MQSEGFDSVGMKPATFIMIQLNFELVEAGEAGVVTIYYNMRSEGLDSMGLHHDPNKH